MAPPVHGQHSSLKLLSCLAHRVLLGLAAPGTGTGLGFSHPYCWFESMGNQNCGQSCWVRSLSGAGDLSPALWRLAMCRDGSIVQGCFLAPSYLVRQIRGTGELCRTGFFRLHLPARLLFRIQAGKCWALWLHGREVDLISSVSSANTARERTGSDHPLLPYRLWAPPPTKDCLDEPCQIQDNPTGHISCGKVEHLRQGHSKCESLQGYLLSGTGRKYLAPCQPLQAGLASSSRDSRPRAAELAPAEETAGCTQPGPAVSPARKNES